MRLCEVLVDATPRQRSGAGGSPMGVYIHMVCTCICDTWRRWSRSVCAVATLIRLKKLQNFPTVFGCIYVCFARKGVYCGVPVQNDWELRRQKMGGCAQTGQLYSWVWSFKKKNWSDCRTLGYMQNPTIGPIFFVRPPVRSIIAQFIATFVPKPFYCHPPLRRSGIE